MNRGVSYSDLKTNTPICDSYVSAMRAMGHSTVFDNTGQINTLNGGSTDMGIAISKHVAYTITDNLQEMSLMQFQVSMEFSPFKLTASIIRPNSPVAQAQTSRISAASTAQREWPLSLGRF